MPSSHLLFGVNEAGFVVLGLNNYEYTKNTTVMNLLQEYKKVYFDNQFDSGIAWLPDGITDIGLGMNFNQPLENLPSTVKRITIAKYNEVGVISFNQPLEYLPDGLEELTIKYALTFNQALDNLPSGLKRLTIGSSAFNYPINQLPNNLEYINISKFNYNNTFNLPTQLKHIAIGEYKYNVENLDKLEYNGLRQLQNNYPKIEFVYKN